MPYPTLSFLDVSSLQCSHLRVFYPKLEIYLSIGYVEKKNNNIFGAQPTQADPEIRQSLYYGYQTQNYKEKIKPIITLLPYKAKPIYLVLFCGIK